MHGFRIIKYDTFREIKENIRRKRKNKMRRRIIFGIAMSACFGAVVALTGCGSESRNDETITAKETVIETATVQETTVYQTEPAVTEAEIETTAKSELPSMKELYNDIAKTAGISDMYQIDGEDLADSYGIDVSNCKDYVFYQANTAPNADTIALFNCNDAKSAKKIAEGLEIVLEDLKTTNKDYAPEEYAKASKSKVVTKNEFVYLIICDKLSEAEDVINQY